MGFLGSGHCVREPLKAPVPLKMPLQTRARSVVRAKKNRWDVYLGFAPVSFLFWVSVMRSFFSTSMGPFLEYARHPQWLPPQPAPRALNLIVAPLVTRF